MCDSISFQGELTVGHCSTLGYGGDSGEVSIGYNLKIGAFVAVERNVIIGDNCEIGNYCTVHSDSKIGNNVKILSGSTVYWGAVIGDGAIINGNISERVVIEQDVRFFGKIAHSHRDHTRDWDTTEEPSPVFRRGSFIGLGAMIVGAINIGENAYVAAGEIVRADLPDNSVFYKNSVYDKKKFRGLIV